MTNEQYDRLSITFERQVRRRFPSHEWRVARWSWVAYAYQTDTVPGWLMVAVREPGGEWIENRVPFTGMEHRALLTDGTTNVAEQAIPAVERQKAA